MLTMEQIVRDVLEKAIQDGLVRINHKGFCSGNGDPQTMLCGDLCGTANLLAERLEQLKAQRKA